MNLHPQTALKDAPWRSKGAPWWIREAHSLREHVEKLTRGMPSAWVDVIHREWAERRAVNAQASAHWGFGQVRALRRAEQLGVLAGDGDADICRKAEREARLMASMFDAVQARVLKLRPVGSVRTVEWDVNCYGEVIKISRKRTHTWVARLIERCKVWMLRADLRRRGVEECVPEGREITRAGIVSRFTDPTTWRRILRRIHATLLEGSAIGLGLVHAGRRGGCYVSAESLKRRRGQRARNAAAMASTVAVNDQGQAETLANIASRGVANGEVRRAELMTRISGFELIANDLGHRATFVTLTCPSRMHKWRRGKALDTPNPAYDGTLPNEAQAYLALQWQRFRAAAQRAGLGLYGFRIAEPHHDGCPHWHMLLWHKPMTDPVGKKKRTGDASIALGLLLGRYFLANESPDEPGADRYRIKVEAIDPSKGSAVAYVAKYVAKNIDGMHVGRDLYGAPAMEASERVEAWASTWRIRQFQQIGGAPVGVWRELRRVHPGAVPMGYCEALHGALMAVSLPSVDAVMAEPDKATAQALKAAGVEAEQGDTVTAQQHRSRAGWAAYIKAQGGPTAKRSAHTLRVMREVTGEANRFGEVGAPKTVGVMAKTWERVTVGIATFMRPRFEQVESERSSWVTAGIRPEDGGSMARVVARLKGVMDARAEKLEQSREARRLAKVVPFAQAADVRRARGEAARPWTRVNNCTQEPIGYSVHRARKRGRVFRWTGGRSQENGHGTQRNRGPGPQQ